MRITKSLLLLLLLISGVQVYANPIYQFSGTVQIVGAVNACDGQRCVETVNFSFPIEIVLMAFPYGINTNPGRGPGNYYVPVLAGPMWASSDGPLQALIEASLVGRVLNYDKGFYVCLANGTGYADSIDLYLGNAFGFDNQPPPVPYMDRAEIYTCLSPECFGQFKLTPFSTLAMTSSVTSVESVPEPTSLTLCVVSLSLAFLKRKTVLTYLRAKPL